MPPPSERRPAPDLDPAGAGGGGDRRAEERRRGEATEVRPAGSGEPTGSARLLVLCRWWRAEGRPRGVG